MQYQIKGIVIICVAFMYSAMPGYADYIDTDDCPAISNITGDISWISNPALLGTKEFIWSFRLARLNGSVGNNALNLEEYKKYNGEYLSADDKRDILDAISGDTAELNTMVTADALSFRWSNFGFYTRSYGGVSGGIDKSFVDILFFGNKLDETYSFLNTGSALAYSSIGVAYGHPSGRLSDWDISVGGSLRFILGFGAADVVESHGETETAIDGIDGWTETTIRYSKGTGSGLAFDFGIWARRERWEVQISLNDVGSTVTFDEAEEKYFFLEFEDWTFEDESEENGHAYESEDTTITLDSWSCPLPIRLNTLVGYHFDWGHVYIQWLQGLKKFAGNRTTPRISIGTEWRAREWLLPRLQLDIGGPEGFSVATGTGFRVGPAEFDLAVTSFGFPPMNSKGIGAAFSIGFGS